MDCGGGAKLPLWADDGTSSRVAKAVASHAHSKTLRAKQPASVKSGLS